MLEHHSDQPCRDRYHCVGRRLDVLHPPSKPPEQNRLLAALPLKEYERLLTSSRARFSIAWLDEPRG